MNYEYDSNGKDFLDIESELEIGNESEGDRDSEDDGDGESEIANDAQAEDSPDEAHDSGEQENGDDDVLSIFPDQEDDMFADFIENVPR